MNVLPPRPVRKTVESFNRERQTRSKTIMVLVRHVEGRTILLVPQASLKKDPPPTSPVFFNPAASLNRDVSVAVTSVAGGSTFCDSMAGVGARGIRVAKEVEHIEKVTIVDFNREALGAARRAAVINHVGRKCEFSVSETNSYLASRCGRGERFDFVDVDPFGTPVRHLQDALNATEDAGIISVTATDTAVLCGVCPKVSKRRYGSAPLNNYFHHETAVRILLGAIARRGTSFDLGVEPVIAHSTRHYVRVYARVRVGASRADMTLKGLGYISWCPSCGNTSSSQAPDNQCEKCGGSARVAGPLWVGSVAQTRMVEAAEEAARKMELMEAARVLRSMVGVNDFPPWSYSIEGICSSLGVATASASEVREELARCGYRTYGQPFEPTGLKTNADYAAVREAVQRVSMGSGRSRRGGRTGLP